MKKITAIFVVLLTTVMFVGCGASSKAQEAYNALGAMTISDENILTSEETAKYASLKETRESALEAKDVDTLVSLKSEWEDFSIPINDFVEEYKTIENSFFTTSEKKLLTEQEIAECDMYETEIKSAYQNRSETELQDLYEQWSEYSENIRAVLEAYNSIDQSPFSSKDLSFLSSEDSSKMDSLVLRTETALSERDASAIISLKSEWSTFVTSTQKSIEDAKEEMLSDWVESANVTSSLFNLFTLGTTTSSTSINGHKITYTTQYNYDTSDSDIKSSLDSYLSFTSTIFESGVSQLKQFVDDVCIRIEYKNKNGVIISYKEFR